MKLFRTRKGFSRSSVLSSVVTYAYAKCNIASVPLRSSYEERLQHIESVSVRLQIDVRRRARPSRVNLLPLTIHLDEHRPQESMIGSDTDDSDDLRCRLNRHALIPVVKRQLVRQDEMRKTNE